MSEEKKIGLDTFHGSYALRKMDPDFSKGHRHFIRYATPSRLIHLDNLNPNGPDPFDYLHYAKEDLLTNDTRGAINALGNTKRAIHIIVDKLLWIFGVEKAFSKSNFPDKLKIISDLEVFPVGIINILNQERNYVEHEYKSISPREVEKFIDITELLLLVTYPLLRSAVVGVIVGTDESDGCYEWVLSVTNSTLTNYLITHDKFISTEIGTIHYNFEHDRKSEQIENFIITKNNTNKWLPVLNLLAYLTKSRALKLSCEKSSSGYSMSEVSRKFFDLEDENT